MIRSRSERDDLCVLCGEKFKKGSYNFLYNKKITLNCELRFQFDEPNRFLLASPSNFNL